jgi:hypothetical protein
MEPSNDVSVPHIRWERTRNQSAKYRDRSQQNGRRSVDIAPGWGTFLPHPMLRRVPGSKTSARTLLRDNPLPVGGSPAMLSVLSFFMQRQWRYFRAWPESSSRSHERRL